MAENQNLRLSEAHQRLVVTGLLRNPYILSQASQDMDDTYFTDSSCRIIYRALSDYYAEYGEMPREDEMDLAVEGCYVDMGDSLETVKATLHHMYAMDPVNEAFLLDKTVDLIRRVKVSRTLRQTFEKIRNGTTTDDAALATDLIQSLEVDYSHSGILCLSDSEGVYAARQEAIGDGSSEVIQSVLPSINSSLQYHGYQRGTMNLIVSPPGCFVGETRVVTEYGSRRIDLLEQEGGRVLTYGCSPEGDVRESFAQYAYLSGYRTKLVDVTLRCERNETTIRCTPDHPFLKRDCKGYVRADRIRPGTELAFTCRPYEVASVVPVELPEPVPVYGLVEANPFHNYALDLGEGDAVFVSNTGKTSYLVNEGAAAAMQGFHVLHVFLGDMIQYDGFVRYVSNISGELQNDVANMTDEAQAELVRQLNDTYNGVMNRIALLSYGSGEVTVDSLIENIRNEQKRTGVRFDDIIIDYADNFEKDDTSLYTEGGRIYDRLALFGRTNGSVIMVASQPKIQYWKEEIIPLEGASESSKKQHIVDLLMTFNLVDRNSKIGTIFIPKVRRGISGRLVRVQTQWERCRIVEITEADYNLMKMDPTQQQSLLPQADVPSALPSAASPSLPGSGSPAFPPELMGSVDSFYQGDGSELDDLGSGPGSGVGGSDADGPADGSGKAPGE